MQSCAGKPTIGDCVVTKSALFFTFSSADDYHYTLLKANGKNFDEIILAVGGLAEPDREGQENSRQRVKIFYEDFKLGKSRSYNRAIQNSSSDLTFLISGDTRFEDNVIESMVQCLGDKYGMAIPRVIPITGKTLAGRIAQSMWDFHDTHMAYNESRGLFFCGGEFQVLRSKYIIMNDRTVNDDEYLCSQTFRSGAGIKYCRNVIINNFMPESFGRLMRQRVRVNFGHLQSRKFLGHHSSFTLSALNVADSIRVVMTFRKEHPGKIMILCLALIVEVFSIFWAAVLMKSGKDLSVW